MTEVSGSAKTRSAMKQLVLQLMLLLNIFSYVMSVATVEVNTKYGSVRGYISTQDSAEAGVFKGIPFAKPPVGDLRWRPPQIPDNWTGVKDALTFQHNCLQNPSASMMGWKQPLDQLSEDCLYLNVYTPRSSLPQAAIGTTVPSIENVVNENSADNQNESLAPVLFWIYGGGFQGGGGNETRLNGTWVSLLKQNIVIVTFNYRLNVFGFLAADILRERDPDNSTGNYGIQDQRMALQWVQQNIQFFGGDPKRVMIVGQSAGAASVSEHLVRSKSWGLFHFAGMESGAFYTENDERTVTELKPDFKALVEEAKCRDDKSEQKEIQCLVSLDAQQLLQVELRRRWKPNSNQWQPTVDGIELLKPGVELAQEGTLAPGVPILIGSVSEDIAIYGSSGCHPELCDADDFLLFAKKNVGLNDSAAEELQTLYSDERVLPGGNYTAWFWAQKHAGADAWATCPARRLARWNTDSPGRLSDPQNAFLYYWSYAPKGPNGQYPKLAHHACEQPFVFHVLNETKAELAEDGGVYHIDCTEVEFSKTIVDLWTSFAASGKPIATGVDWPAFKKNQQTLHIAQDTIEPVVDLRAKKCDFFDSLFAEGKGAAANRNWAAALERELIFL